jgi:uncharacterized protein YbjT (DUF2867 family)
MNNSKFPTILITGATGNIGMELTKQLAAKGIPFRALVRKVKNAGELSIVNWCIDCHFDFCLRNVFVTLGESNSCDTNC